MSSSATIRLDELAHDLAEFFAKHEIVHSPQTVGGNVYYQGGLGGVEVKVWSHDGHGVTISFSHFFMGSRLHDVARLALAAWAHWGGYIEASPEIRDIIARRAS